MLAQRYTFILSTLVLLLSACDLVHYHPYEGRISGETGLTEKNLKRIEDLRLGPQFKFAFISDTQRWYDDTGDVVAAINRRGDIDFVLHGGDITDFGVTEEFEWMRDVLQGFRMPWVTLIGNHDFLGHGSSIYRKMFGPFNYGFTVGHVRFEMINTVALELDYSTPVPDFEFLQKEFEYIDSINALYPDSIRQTIFTMHSRPGDEQFNNNVAIPFSYYLRFFPGMTPETDRNPDDGKLPSFCLNGHNHHNETLEPFDNGILFHGIANIAKRSYFVITINNDDSYELEIIDF